MWSLKREEPHWQSPPLWLVTLVHYQSNLFLPRGCPTPTGLGWHSDWMTGRTGELGGQCHERAAAQMTMADNRNVIGEKTLKAVYHWTQVHGERQDDSKLFFSDGSPMDPRSVAEWRREPFPIPIARA